MTPAGPRDAAAFEVREALGESGCVVCRLSLRSVSRLIRSIAYEQVNDLSLREQLRRAAGFCNAHAYQWLAEARSVLGTALIYRDVLNASLAEMDSRRGGRLRGLLGGGQPEASCPLCAAQADSEVRYLDTLLSVVSPEPSVVDASDGLCRRHTLAALRMGGAGAEALVQRTRVVVGQMLAELDEVIRKEDYRFRDEPRTDAERSVPSRAVAWASGAEGLVADRQI